MTPDAQKKHNPRCGPTLLDALKTAGISNAEAARRIGVHRNHLVDLKRGRRDGRPADITYAHQFALECLLEATQAMRKR